MKIYLLLLCTTVFSLSSNNIVSQNTKVRIDVDKIATIDQVFKIINKQTDYSFIYKSDLFEGLPKVKLKKGSIRVSELLNGVIAADKFNVILSHNNSIIIKTKDKKQQREITGLVSNESGFPFEGVTIIVKGTTIGVVTNVDGVYKIKVSDPDNVLVFSYLGFKTQEITVGNQDVIDVKLQEDTSELEEVILVGYGTAKKKDLTGSVSSIKSTDIKQIKSQTIDQTFIGKMPGVYVAADAGPPGSGALVNIRGLSQLIGDNQPLYVVDGIPIVVRPRFEDRFSIGVSGDRENPLLSINPEDIERVDVLKDASAAAIYGSRAANGVILITTKRGKRNQSTNFNFSYNSTIQNPLNTYDLLNASQFREHIISQGSEGLLNPSFGNADTDWQDEITNNNALWNQYNFNVSGGTSKSNYFVSANVTEQEGVMLGNKFSRYSISSSLDTDLNDRLKTGFNFSYNYSINKTSRLNSLAAGGFWRPDLPVFNDDGSYSTITNFLGDIRNPVGDMAKAKNKAVAQNFVGSVFGEFKIIDELSFRSQIGINITNDKSTAFTPSFSTFALFDQRFNGRAGAQLNIQHNNGISASWSNTLNFNKTFNDIHTLNAVVGIAHDYSKLELDSQAYSGFPDDEILTDIQSAQQLDFKSSDASQTALNSLFARINYNYDNRYLLTFTARSDKSIKFGPDNRSGFFPSGAIAWNLHNEKFLKDNDLISQIKLRASIGRTGSDNLPAFTFLANYAAQNSGGSIYDGVNGIVVTGIPNDEIRWEETDQLDIGLNFGLFNDRLSGEITYFEKKTSDIILLTPLPAQTGFSRWNSNIADVSNKGWELLIGGDIIRSKNFKWNSSFNISFIDNNVDALNGGQTTSFGSFGIKEGQPIGFIEGYDIISIAQAQDEIDALNTAAPDGNYYSGLTQPGDYIYKDVNEDGEITSEDIVPLGDINPDFFGGWNNTLSYKNFDFTFNFNYVKGNDKIWFRGDAELSNVNLFRNVTTNVFNTWSPDNTDAEYARFGSRTHERNSKIIEDASYIKLRSASIAYNFPKHWLNKTGLNNVKLSISGNNLFVITNYPGIDPESNDGLTTGSTVYLQNDNGFSYPQMRTFTIGIDIGL
ncbi:TonB-dependent receptor [Sabulilitoribacter arenilitoris]|uniref:TonB-dependent receptor n=1 Tax=Wocania arenilitoris TaxID=2044858 RepID=A0AAE3ENJ3_9FLAO|nr:TonB-dependent receptor [Wocania arenilitoris]MCF7568711.1 TonB-dependent receptor [Wocania arenilitoris]